MKATGTGPGRGRDAGDGREGEGATQREMRRRIALALGGQDAPRSTGGEGRRVLWRCPACGRPWLMDGATVRLRLDASELDALARELGAELATLPYATCRLCGAQGVGELGIDQYGAGDGYGVSWEAVKPDGGHLLGVAIRLDWLGRQHSERDMHAGIVTDFARCRAFLAWLARVQSPLMYHRLDGTDSAFMALTNRPGHDAPGTDGWVWRGATWQAPVPALAGRCYISLAQAMPPDEPFSLPAMLAAWRALAVLLQSGNIAGEGDPASSTERTGRDSANERDRTGTT